MPTLLAILALLPLSAQADATDGFSVPLSQHGSGGYYVRGVFADGVESELLVDTGSSYVVLTKDTFARLKRSGATTFARTIRGTTAAGRLMEAKVYSISVLALGASCVLRDVEAVVLRNADRDILGLSALRRLQPFSLNFEPAELAASTCNSLSKVALAGTTSE
jgi:clan AA aspartic protease (TIGR02281 family)